MADYATATQIKGFSADASQNTKLDSTQWELLATAASRHFDRLCEVEDDFFKLADAEFVERDFYGSGTAYLTLPPFTALNGTDPVVIEDSVYEVPEYVVVGNQLVIKDLTRSLNINEYYWSRNVGWKDAVKVTVSAKWGFAAVPKDVTLAVIQIALLFWRQSDPSFATIANADNGLAEEQIPPFAMSVVKAYREKYSQRSLFA